MKRACRTNLPAGKGRSVEIVPFLRLTSTACDTAYMALAASVALAGLTAAIIALARQVL